MENDLCVGIAQTGIVWENIEASLNQLDAMLEDLPSCDLLVLPETFTTGFTMKVEALSEDPEGLTTDWLRQKAYRHQVAIIGSTIIKIGNSYRNRLLFVKPDGRVSHYDKHHLFTYAGEDKHYTPGDKKLIINWRGWRICPMVCYDLRFPAWSRNLDEYDLLVYVANWPKPRVAHWRRLLPARAIENQCYVAGCNRIGSDGNGIQYTGDSGIWDFHGDMMVEASDRNGIFRGELSATRLMNYRREFPFLKDRDQFVISVADKS
jgi:predicted amidohydrolase